ncbi:hypothetical protein [Phenylobacterium koreense]|uniref:Uncharacterized protein n=1 Tax=Phenylobacterium koreense TaxID=266125 RepID=A0ABV2EJV6_9CAUL
MESRSSCRPFGVAIVAEDVEAEDEIAGSRGLPPEGGGPVGLGDHVDQRDLVAAPFQGGGQMVQEQVQRAVA